MSRDMKCVVDHVYSKGFTRALIGRPKTAYHAPRSELIYPNTVKMDTNVRRDPLEKALRLAIYIASIRCNNIVFVSSPLPLLISVFDLLILIAVIEENIVIAIKAEILISKNMMKSINSRRPHSCGRLTKRQAPVFDSNILTCVSNWITKTIMHTIIKMLHFCHDL